MQKASWTTGSLRHKSTEKEVVFRLVRQVTRPRGLIFNQTQPHASWTSSLALNSTSHLLFLFLEIWVVKWCTFTTLLQHNFFTTSAIMKLNCPLVWNMGFLNFCNINYTIMHCVYFYFKLVSYWALRVTTVHCVHTKILKFKALTVTVNAISLICYLTSRWRPALSQSS